MSNDAHIGWSIVWYSEVSTWHVDSNIGFWTTANTDHDIKQKWVICLHVQNNFNIFSPKYFWTNTNLWRIQIICTWAKKKNLFYVGMDT